MRNTLDNRSLSHPIGDLRKQISRRPSWKTILKALYIFRLVGVVFGLLLFILRDRQSTIFTTSLEVRKT